MTKAMRWGVAALTMFGGVAFGGAFAGCGDDDPVNPAPVDSGTDTTPTDTNPTPSDASDASDTAPPGADRAATLVFASPDLGGKFVCFGAFTSDPATATAPLQALGPIGRPDPADATNPAKFTALPYGAVVPLPLNSQATAALENLTTVVYLVDQNPAAMSPAKSCADMWATAKTDTKMWKSFPAKAIAKGDHGLVIMHGCQGTTPSAECGNPVAPLEFTLEKADLTTPSTFAGGGTNKVGIQFFNLSAYKGGAASPPSLQDVDVYLAPGAATPSDAGTDGGDGGDAGDAGDGGTAAGDIVKIASGLSYKGKAATSVGVSLKGDPANAVIIFTPKGEAPSCGFSLATPLCKDTWIPLSQFLTAYQPTGGGLVNNTNQFVTVAGSVVPSGGQPTIRIQFGLAKPH